MLVVLSAIVESLNYIGEQTGEVNTTKVVLISNTSCQVSQGLDQRGWCQRNEWRMVERLLRGEINQPNDGQL